MSLCIRYQMIYAYLVDKNVLGIKKLTSLQTSLDFVNWY